MSDDDQVARLFKENDDLGAASSLWLRPLRQLFEHGKPIGQVRALTISLVEKQSLPFGMIMYTEKNRLETISKRVFMPIFLSVFY
ncbi:MAG: hypothetical protein IID33_18345 [Planctomycetes bacterium]|nr:hypothetical protein [Planctomycetota bacterium]